MKWQIRMLSGAEDTEDRCEWRGGWPGQWPVQINGWASGAAGWSSSPSSSQSAALSASFSSLQKTTPSRGQLGVAVLLWWWSVRALRSRGRCCRWRNGSSRRTRVTWRWTVCPPDPTPTSDSSPSPSPNPLLFIFFQLALAPFVTVTVRQSFHLQLTRRSLKWTIDVHTATAAPSTRCNYSIRGRYVRS